LRRVRRSPFENESAIAIAAVDETDLVIDLIIDARMAERGRDLPRPVAMDSAMAGANGLGRRD
jgi:hypothetical protein